MGAYGRMGKREHRARRKGRLGDLRVSVSPYVWGWAWGWCASNSGGLCSVNRKQGLRLQTQN